MRSGDESSVDWSGVQPDQSPIAPLDAESFLARIELLSQRARILTILRRAFVEQDAHAGPTDADIGSRGTVRIDEPTDTHAID
jgi:hypothetical protein